MSKITAIALKLIVSLFFSVIVLTSGRASEVLTFYAVNFPPYEIEHPKRPDLRGFDVEVILAAFKRVSIEAEIEFRPWNRIVSLAKEGRIAGMVSCAWKKERDRYIRFSEPISYATHSFVVKEQYKGKVLRSLEDAIDLRNLVVAGYVTEVELETAKVDFDRAMNDQLAITRLLERPYDTFYASKENIEYLARENSFSDKIRIFEIRKTSYHLCFSKKWPNSDVLTIKFNEGLAALIKDGTYQTIHDKYR